jgi:hypothetical protein
MSDSKVGFPPHLLPSLPKPSAPAHAPVPHAPAAPAPQAVTGFIPAAHGHAPVDLAGRAAHPEAVHPVDSHAAHTLATTALVAQLRQLHIDPEAMQRFVFSHRAKQLHLDASMAVHLKMGTLDDAALSRLAEVWRSQQRQDYTIQPGDTLYQIATSLLPHGASPEEIWAMAYQIAKENGVENPDLIIAGKHLKLPPPQPGSARAAQQQQQQAHPHPAEPARGTHPPAQAAHHAALLSEQHELTPSIAAKLKQAAEKLQPHEAKPPHAPLEHGEPLARKSAPRPKAQEVLGKAASTVSRARDAEVKPRNVALTPAQREKLKLAVARMTLGRLTPEAIEKLKTSLQAKQAKTREDYPVQDGDTLYGIARSRLPPGASEEQVWALVYQIAEENGIQDPNLIHAGSTLKVPPPQTAAPSQTGATPPYDLEAANAHASQFSYDEEGDGTQLSESYAQMAINGGQPDFGDDGSLNCNQGCAEMQNWFANQKPPVPTEVVVKDGHSVLRMPDGTYYDPSRAMKGGPPGDPHLTAAEGAKYRGTDGVSLAERDAIQTAARDAVRGLPPGTPEFVREHLATGAAKQKAARIEADANQLANDADGKPATPDEAKARADEARARVGQDPATAEADADYALQAMREANEMARASGAPPPYPQAEAIVDGAAAARLNAQQQTDLFGKPLPTTHAQMVERDVGTLNPNDPMASAVQLEQTLATASPEYRAALLSDPRVQAILGAMATAQPDFDHYENYEAGINALVRLSELMGPEQLHLITDPIAQHMTREDTPPEFKGALGKAITAPLESPTQSLGMAFAVSLDASLHVAGKADMASDIHGIVQAGLANVSQEFAKVAEDVAKAEAELALFLQDLGGGMDDAQIQQAIDKFMQSHAELYARFEKLGALMGKAMGAIQARALGNPDTDYGHIAENLAHQLPALGMTQAGSEVLEQMVADAAAGKPGILDYALAIGKNDPAYIEKLSVQMFECLGSEAAELMAKGNYEGAQALLNGPISKYAALFGVDEAKFKQVMTTLDGLTRITPRNAQEAQQAFQDALGQLKGILGDGRLLQALGGVALGMATISFARGLSQDFTPDNLSEALGMASDAVGLGHSIASVGARILGKKVALEFLEGVAGKVVNRFGIGVDAFRAVHALWHGDTSRAGAFGLSAVGGVPIVAGGPVGWVVGGAMVIGGAIWSVMQDAEEDRVKARKQFLLDAGVDPTTAEVLANAPEGRLRQLVEMGFTYDDIMAMATGGSWLLKGDVSSDRLNELKTLGFTAAQVKELEQTYPSLLTDTNIPLGNFIHMAQMMGLNGDAAFDLLKTVGMGDQQKLIQFLNFLETRVPRGDTKELWAFTLQVAYETLTLTAEHDPMNAELKTQLEALMTKLGIPLTPPEPG